MVMTGSILVSERYARQTIFPSIGETGQNRLRATRVCLIGCGALGTHIADTLVRAGFGFVRIVDRDIPVQSNLQRQSLFDEQDVIDAIPKVIAAAKRLNAVNSDVMVEPHVLDVNATNIEPLVADVDFVVDGSDNFEIRYLINDICVKLNKPWVYGGVIGSYGMTMTIRPGVTPCLRCVFPEAPAPGEAPTCDTAGVIGPAVTVVAGLQSAEAMKLAVGAIGELNPDLLAIDVWNVSVDQIPLGAPSPDCPTCGQHDFTFLEQSAPSQTTDLCGRDAVQVSVFPPANLSLPTLAERLKAVGQVGYNDYLLRCNVDNFELTVFPDGRAIVKGTTDPSVARSVYARYIGM
ncbi:MAG: ThiF family adenylyltransferase [Nitrolancea sp.]